MPPENVMTREEIKAMLDVQSKSTEQMTLVAQRLQVLVDQQSKIVDMLKNGLNKDLAETVKTTLDTHLELIKIDQKETKDNTKAVKDDVKWMKIILGGFTLVITIVEIVLKIIGKG